MELPASRDYMEWFVMRRHVKNLSAKNALNRKNVPTSIVQNIFEETINALDSISSTSLGIYPFVEALNNMACCLLKESSCTEAISYLKAAETAYNTYQAQELPESAVWCPKQLFLKHGIHVKIFNPEGSLLNLSNLDIERHFTNILLCSTYCELADLKNSVKYTMPSLIGEVKVNQLLSGKSYIPFSIRCSIPFIEDFIQSYHFKQADHLLAVAMYHTVKARRETPPNERSLFNPVQGKISLLYALLGMAITAIYYKHKLYSKPIPEINNEWSPLEQLMEDGVNVYENQFAYDQVTTFSKLSAICKLSIAWSKRATELLDESPDKDQALEIGNELKTFETKLALYVKFERFQVKD